MCVEAVVERGRLGQADTLPCGCVMVVVAGGHIFSESLWGRGSNGDTGAPGGLGGEEELKGRGWGEHG